jgi:hypothetical protein
MSSNAERQAKHRAKRRDERESLRKENDALRQELEALRNDAALRNAGSQPQADE